MPASLSPRWKAVLQALLVTFLWSTSWVLIKIGLEGIPALTFAGLRYSLAFLCLVPVAAIRARTHGTAGRVHLTRSDWAGLAVLGLLFYAVAQGAQFLALYYLPAATVSLLLNFTSVLVALLGIVFLKERPTVLQWLGMALFMAGVGVYFYPLIQDQAGGRDPALLLGLTFAAAGVISNALSAVLGRSINRRMHLSPLTVTLVSMGIGSGLLLASGLLFQGLPPLTLTHWLIIAWLAVVNTAFAFTLWNTTLRVLSAMESSIIAGTMLIQIALLAWIFLGEALTPARIFGMAVSALGAVVVQLRPGRAGHS
jgi:drug/metabolite transporter (DMT)-like permease